MELTFFSTMKSYRIDFFAALVLTLFFAHPLHAQLAPFEKRYSYNLGKYRANGWGAYDSPELACKSFESPSAPYWKTFSTKIAAGKWQCWAYNIYYGDNPNPQDASGVFPIIGACQIPELVTPLSNLPPPAQGFYYNGMEWNENDGMCYCYYEGQIFDPTTQWCKSVRGATTIELRAPKPSRTKSLPAGPTLTESAQVKRDGVPVAKENVQISIDGFSAYSGVTDQNGEFKFLYIPPYVATEVQLTASCDSCSNSDTKAIIVDACNVCENNRGNPVQPATGEKIEIITDWQDNSQHPLSIIRYYRSFGNVKSNFGANWSLWPTAEIQSTGPLKIIQFTTGEKIAFKSDNQGQWTGTDATTDTLKWINGAWIYTRHSDDTQWKFSADGRLLENLDRSGWAYIFTYTSRNQLASITNAFGRRIEIQLDLAGRLIGIKLPTGDRISYDYLSSGLLSSSTFMGQTNTYLYEDARFPNALTGAVDADGRRLGTFVYDELGRTIRTSRSGNAGDIQLIFAGGSGSASKGRITSATVSDPNWYKASVNITNPQGGTEVWNYQGGDGQVRVASVNGAFEGNQIANRSFVAGTSLPSAQTDFRGTTTQTSWDTARRLPTQEVKAANRSAETQSTATEWHPQFRLPVKITETGAQGGTRVTTYTYDERGNRLTETVTGTGLTSQTRSWAYTAQNLVASETDESGAITRHTYDRWGNRVSTTDPLGKTTTYTHDAAGRVLTQTDPSGVVTAYTYDLRGRLLSQTVGGLTTVMTYLPTGLLSSVTQPSGYKTTYTYDAAHRLTGWQDNRGNSGSYVLDGMGNRTSEQTKDAAGNIAFALSRTINAINRVASETVGGTQSVSYQYDANGDLIGHTNGLNQSTAYTLDGLRRLSAERNPANAQASLAYNALDAITQAQDFKGVATTYTRDAQGNAPAEASPDIGTTVTTFDPRGLPSTSQDAAGRSQSITRDALGRPTTIDRGAGAISTLVYE
ncbi:DUF6531 domain-containing protein [Ottowia testudinis]|uniref:RHS repeat protein n=1 Tax=Ottowia testudinis TaxID=2816950 RepID=A0A975CCM7_9BURK|nr:DUF6531 domain-containing protein [Ottowia testudinis]QTD43825.1 RHS repeat protein [Ottowia testudinis]